MSKSKQELESEGRRTVILDLMTNVLAMEKLQHDKPHDAEVLLRAYWTTHTAEYDAELKALASGENDNASFRLAIKASTAMLELYFQHYGDWRKMVRHVMDTADANGFNPVEMLREAEASVPEKMRRVQFGLSTFGGNL